MSPEVMTEAVEPEKIAYKRGSVYVYLTGLNASLFRAMIWLYGEATATERFWWLWHKKSDVLTPENVAPSL